MKQIDTSELKRQNYDNYYLFKLGGGLFLLIMSLPGRGWTNSTDHDKNFDTFLLIFGSWL